MRLSEVLIAQDATEQSFVPVPLNDFRLHRWSTVAFSEIAESDRGRGVVGRIKGKAYGYIAPRGTIKPPQSRVSETSAVALGSEGIHKGDGRIVSAETMTSSQPSVPEIQTKAPASVGMRSDGTVDPSVRNLFSPPVEPERLTGSSLPASGGSSPCLCCHPAFVYLLSGIVWAGCGIKVGLVGLLTMTLACWLNRQVSRKGETGTLVNRRFGWNLMFIEGPWLGPALAVLSAIGIALFLFPTRQQDCANPNAWLLLLPLLALLLGAFVDSCRVKLILFILWFIVLLCWGGLHIDGCNRIGGSGWLAPIKASLSTISQKIDNFFAFDIASSTVSDASQNFPDERRLSVDDVKNNPNLLSNCRNSVYFPNATMFEHGDHQILPRAEAQLAKLDVLRSANQDVKIVVIGHADRSGETTPDGIFHNIELSERRANSVSDWLIAHGWRPDQIEARGVGSRFPLIDAPGDQPFNRRVEIKLHCRNNEAGQPIPGGQ
ncbi:MAG: OmpA family protein [Proteobacteria bacterium]|nr:OmpA family protein [Pseudomonadota bacterium]